jgi:hypothetical protein
MPCPVEQVNTEFPETWPCVSSDGLVLFFSRYEGGILCAKREEKKLDFGPSRRLGPPVRNEVGGWVGHFRVSQGWPAKGSLAYFVVGKGKGPRSLDIYRAAWRPLETENE